MDERDRAIKIATDKLEAIIPKKDPKQWMTRIKKGSFLDKATSFREIGDGLMVIDWLMEAGSNEGYSDQVIALDGRGVGKYSWYKNGTEPERQFYTRMSQGPVSDKRGSQRHSAIYRASHVKRKTDGKPQLCYCLL